MIGPNNPIAKVPQILNAALAASVIICFAQRTPDILRALSEAELHWGWLIFSSGIVLAFCLKQFVDEFRAFEYANYEDSNFLRTVVMGVLSYLCLASAAYNLDSQSNSFVFVFAYFAVCIAWSILSVLDRAGTKEDQTNEERLAVRWQWIVIYSVALVIVSANHFELFGAGWPQSLVFIVLIFGVYVYDVLMCKTFDPKHMKGVREVR